MNLPQVYMCSPSRTLLPPHTIPLGRPSAPAPSIWENGNETCKISCRKRVASPGRSILDLHWGKQLPLPISTDIFQSFTPPQLFFFFFSQLYFIPVFILLGHVFESIHRWPKHDLFDSVTSAFIPLRDQHEHRTQFWPKKTWGKFADGHRGCLERCSLERKEIHEKSVLSFTWPFSCCPQHVAATLTQHPGRRLRPWHS